MSRDMEQSLMKPLLIHIPNDSFPEATPGRQRSVSETQTPMTPAQSPWALRSQSDRRRSGGRGKWLLGETTEINNNIGKVGVANTSPQYVTSMRSPGSLISSPKSPAGDVSTTPTCSFCNRTTRNIICRACGHTFQGRVRSECSRHPRIMHLMDLEACPNCKAYQLREFGESTPSKPQPSPRLRLSLSPRNSPCPW